jgi:two-component system cell cycle sensor histidine kinase/response regulator CckA
MALKLHQSRKQLEQKDALLRRILSNSRDVLYLLNVQNGQYEFVSPSVEEILGFTVKYCLAMGLKGLLEIVHPEDMGVMAQYEEELQPGSAGNPKRYQITYRLKTKGGEYHRFQDRHTLYFDSEGRPEHYIGCLSPLC